MTVKRVALITILFILASGISAVIFQRLLLPYLSALPVLRDFNILESGAPIIITRREEIRIDQDINTQEITNRVRGSLVKIYMHEPKIILGRPVSVTSGMIATNDGLVIASAQAIRGGASITAVLANGQAHPGRLIFVDELSGTAFIKIEANDLSVLSEVSSQNKRSGETLLALNLDEALGMNVKTVAMSSSSAPKPGFSQIYNLTQFNGGLDLDPVFSENSAGAVIVDKDGSLVGFATATPSGMKYVRSEDLRLVMSNFLASGSRGTAWPVLPISYLILGSAQAPLLGLPASSGVVIRQGGRGVEAGDYVFMFDGREITFENDFHRMFFAKKAGEKIKLKLLRGKQELELEITL